MYFFSYLKGLCFNEFFGLSVNVQGGECVPPIKAASKDTFPFFPLFCSAYLLFIMMLSSRLKLFAPWVFMLLNTSYCIYLIHLKVVTFTGKTTLHGVAEVWIGLMV